MNYKKIEKENYNIHVIDSDRFKSTVVQVIFAKNFNSEDLAYDKILKSILVYSTKKYNTKSKMIKKIEDLYGINIMSSCSFTGNVGFNEFTLEFLNPRYTDEKTMRESIDMFMEVLFNPNIKDDAFDEDILKLIKEQSITECKNIVTNPRLYSSLEYNKIMYKGTPNEYSVYSTVEDIEKVSSKKLYKHYKKLFDGSYKIDVIIHGLDGEQLVKYIEKYFDNIKANKNKFNIFVNNKHNNKVIEKENTMPFNQSKIYLGYTVDNYSDEKDYYTFRVLNMILGSMNNSILFDTVREKNSLCYNISSYINRYNPSLTIYSGINKDNKEKAINIIKECVLSLKNKALIDTLLDAARHNIETSLNSYYDDLIGQINNVYMNEFASVLDIESYRSKLLEVGSDDIVNLAKRLKLSVIYFMKGELE